MAIKPIWLCDATSHTDCKCDDNLKKQLDLWRLRIVTDDPSLRNQVFGNSSYSIVPCPYCGLPCEADMIDIGVGLEQCGALVCQRCLASEIGPEMADIEMSWLEKITGWYEPGKPVSSLVNGIVE